MPAQGGHQRQVYREPFRRPGYFRLLFEKFVALRSRPVLRLALGLLLIHASLIPLFFLVTSAIVQQGLRDGFITDARASASLYAHFVAMELGEGDERMIESILDYALEDKRVVFAEVSTNDGRVIPATTQIGVDRTKFLEDRKYGEHGDDMLCLALPLPALETDSAGTLLIAYDETPIEGKTDLVFQRLTHLLIAYILVLLAVHGFLLSKLRRANKTMETQADTIKERTLVLERLSKQLLSAQESERRRIARELHDSIGQSLGALKMQLEMTLSRVDQRIDASVTGDFTAVMAMIQDAIDEVRRMAMAVRPPMLDDLGLIATISWFCREYQASHPEMNIEKSIDIGEEEIPDELKSTIYRIMQEACNNIAKHSKATRVLVRLRDDGDSIDLEIEDNGEGFIIGNTVSTESVPKGFGLTSMRERAELSAGVFSLQSNIGQGTAVRVRWPLAR
jgi:signal transduction histidine kinase